MKKQIFFCILNFGKFLISQGLFFSKNNLELKFKDCYDDCETSLCNNNLDVAEKFDNGKQDTCEVCFYRELEDGSVAGNTNCQDPDAKKSTRDFYECPRWANVACYTGTAQHEFVRI